MSKQALQVLTEDEIKQCRELFESDYAAICSEFTNGAVSEEIIKKSLVVSRSDEVMYVGDELVTLFVMFLQGFMRGRDQK